ncbi:MAG: hypothetical protein JSW55_04415 [Chloroflexota bacterium]|nr:MAG: hypothetical protein JSW55_04415 [Chloroflexota bacterium]
MASRPLCILGLDPTKSTCRRSTITYEANCTLPDELLEQIAEQGFDAVLELIRTIIDLLDPDRKMGDIGKKRKTAAPCS